MLQVPNNIFTTVSVTESNIPSTYETSSYKEVISGLASLWEDQMRGIESITDVSGKGHVMFCDVWFCLFLLNFS